MARTKGVIRVTVVFADLNGRDQHGLYAALIEDADGPVSVGDSVRVVDDEAATYAGHVAQIRHGLVYFTLEAGSASRAPDAAHANT